MALVRTDGVPLAMVTAPKPTLADFADSLSPRPLAPWQRRLLDVFEAMTPEQRAAWYRRLMLR